jgi:hypothetical protein
MELRTSAIPQLVRKFAVSKDWVTSGFTLKGDIIIEHGKSIYMTNRLGARIIMPDVQTVINYISRYSLWLDGSKTMTGSLKMGGNEIVNLGAPTADTSAVNKKWVEDAISGGRKRREIYNGIREVSGYLSGCLTKNHAERFRLKIRFPFYFYHELPLS